MVELQPRIGGAAGGITRESVITSVATDLQGKIPKPFDTVILRKQFGTGIQPIDIVLMQVARTLALLAGASGGIREGRRSPRRLPGVACCFAETRLVAQTLPSAHCTIPWLPTIPYYCYG